MRSLPLLTRIFVSLLVLFFSNYHVSNCFAQGLPVGTSINLGQYLGPGNPPVSVPISSGETFTTMNGNQGEYLQCKNADCSSFQKIFVTPTGYAIQGENYWVGENTTFQYRQGLFDPADPNLTLESLNTQHPQASWLPKQMSVGQIYSPGPMTVVGFSLNGGNIANILSTKWTGPSDELKLRLDYAGPVDFGNGVKADDVLIISVVTGPGTGEKFYYKKGVGWIGWENADNRNVMSAEIMPFSGDPALVLKNLAGSKKYACTVNGTVPQPDTFRPKPCQNCSLSVPKPTYSCAQFPIVVQQQTYRKENLAQCDGPVAVLNWKPVNFKLDTTDTKVPFAGYKETIRGPMDDPVKSRSENENNYLNDYFEGTALYDEREFDTTKAQDMTDLYWEYGVYRKLAPLEMQDDNRKDMITRGFNYRIEGTNHTMQEWGGSHFKPFTGDVNSGRLPPYLDYSTCLSKGNEEALQCKQQAFIKYQDNVKAWLASDWGKYWQHIPLFSREDAPGKIILTIEHSPGTIDEERSTAVQEVPLSIPHLSRLYESTTALYNLLTPTMKDSKTAYVTDRKNSISYVPQTTPVLLAQAAVSDSREPKLLAQGGDYSFQYYPSINPNGTYTFTMVSYNAPTGDVGVDVLINGEKAGMIFGRSNIGDSPVTVSGTFNPATTQSISFIVTYNGAPAPGCDGNHCYATCINQGGSFACDKSGPPPTPEPNPCLNHSNIKGQCNPKNPLPDLKPNDEVCCSSKAQINVERYLEKVPEDVYQGIMNPTCKVIGSDTDDNGKPYDVVECDDPKGTANMTRKVSVELQVPYLNDIYEKTAGKDKSIFNMFKPPDMPAFPDDDAMSGITYSVQSEALTYLSFSGANDGEQNQSTLKGQLYFPYLGGIQQAKKCVSEQLLIPTEFQNPINQCQFWGGDMFNPITSQPKDTSRCEQLPESEEVNNYRKATTLTRDYLQNQVSDRVRELMGAKAAESYVANFDTIADAVEKYNGEHPDEPWNLAFVLALWVEESAASSVSAWDLGCIYDQDATPLPRNDLPRQLQCLFNKSYAKPDDYRQFMLTYSGEAGNNGMFCNNPGFPGKIYRWYTALTTDVSYKSIQ